jgi:predicted amidohydrolase
MTPKPRALAAAQTLPLPGDVDANVREHVQLARMAAQAGARVVAFSELSLTGYELELGTTLAFSERDARLAPLADVAVSLGVTLIVGAPVRLESGLHIGAFILTPNGGIDIYTKHYLGAFRPEHSADGNVPPPEDSIFVNGCRNPLIALDGRTGAVAVCADGRYPEHAERAAKLGADTYFSCQFAIPDHVNYKLHKLKLAVVAHKLTIVFANFGAATGRMPAGGRTGIWSEQGHCLVELGATGAGVAIAIEEVADGSGLRAQALSV